MVHDIAYRYGFTEKAFNFQSNNFRKGGKGGDRVLVSVHDDSDMNNAGFATPPECVKFILALLKFSNIVIVVRVGCASCIFGTNPG